jgi:hypothetical protein
MLILLSTAQKHYVVAIRCDPKTGAELGKITGVLWRTKLEYALYGVCPLGQPQNILFQFIFLSTLTINKFVLYDL